MWRSNWQKFGQKDKIRSCRYRSNRRKKIRNWWNVVEREWQPSTSVTKAGASARTVWCVTNNGSLVRKQNTTIIHVSHNLDKTSSHATLWIAKRHTAGFRLVGTKPRQYKIPTLTLKWTYPWIKPCKSIGIITYRQRFSLRWAVPNGRLVSFTRLRYCYVL